jgi:hypothetical protein
MPEALMSRVRQACIATGMAAFAAWAPAHAEVAAVAEVGVGHSDNIARTDVDEISETIGTVGLTLDWRERTRRLRGEANIDVSFLEYLDDTFDSEVVGTADGSLVLGLVPETLHWVIEDTFGQARSDPFAPITPDNREDLNYFSTGPDLMMRFGATGFARVFGRWSQTNYEESPLDAERRTAGVSLGRRMSADNELTLNGVTERVEFDDTTFSSDYDRDSVFVGYRLEASRTRLTADLGYTWLDRDGAADTTGNALVNITVERDMTASSLLRLSLGSQLGDAGDFLRGALDSEVVGAGGHITATSDPFENRLVSLFWQFSRNRTGFSLGVARSQDRYEEQTQFDRTRNSYIAVINRRLAPNLDAELSASYDDEKFDNVDLDTEEMRLALRLDWRAWRTLGLRLLIERYDRDASNGLGEYTENRAFLTLAYYWGAPLGHLP